MSFHYRLALLAQTLHLTDIRLIEDLLKIKVLKQQWMLLGPIHLMTQQQYF